MAWLAPAQMSWFAAELVYFWMMISCGLIVLIPGALRLGVAFALTAGGIVVASIWLPVASPLGRVPSVLLLKIVAGHMIGPEASSQ